ncbi:MAG: hypothetical protein ABI718_06220 [Acidobacteriota bacterium]
MHTKDNDKHGKDSITKNNQTKSTGGEKNRRPDMTFASPSGSTTSNGLGTPDRTRGDQSKQPTDKFQTSPRSSSKSDSRVEPSEKGVERERPNKDVERKR